MTPSEKAWNDRVPRKYDANIDVGHIIKIKGVDGLWRVETMSQNRRQAKVSFTDGYNVRHERRIGFKFGHGFWSLCGDDGKHWVLRIA